MGNAHRGKGIHTWRSSMGLPVKIPGRNTDVFNKRETWRLWFRPARESASKNSWPDKLCKAQSFAVDRLNTVDKDFAHESGDGTRVI